jgi:hypothetical protein
MTSLSPRSAIVPGVIAVMWALACAETDSRKATHGIEGDAQTGGSGGNGAAPAAGGRAGSGGGTSGGSPTGGTGGLAPDASADAPLQGTSCPKGLPGPELVFIAAPVPYCIDAREVTQGEYGEFLGGADASSPAQAAECAWNTRFTPTVAPPPDTPPPLGSCPAGAFDPASNNEQAVRCVDWCDARAYCEWAGKRLCGGVGGRITLSATSVTEWEPTTTEWQYACTNGGTTTYPYGNAYVSGKCVDVNAPAPHPLTGSAACTGLMSPFNQVRDLVGNVFEWGFDCDEELRSCEMFGGFGASTDESCAGTSGRTVKQSISEVIGVRCCADAVTP